MELVICGSVFFFIVILFVGIYYLFFGDKYKKGSAFVLNRLKAATLKERRSQAVDIMLQKRELSTIPWLDQLLRVIPFLQKIDRVLEHSGSRYSLIMFLYSTFFVLFLAFISLIFLTKSVLLSVPIAVLLGLIPLLYITNKKKRRVKKFEQQLPEALDMLARSLKAGHAFAGGLHMVAEEFPDPIGVEFEKMIDQINFGVSVKDALSHFAGRMDIADLKYLVVAVAIQRESGGDLAAILESIAKLIRERFQLNDKVLTLSAEGRLSAKILIAVPILLALYFFMTQPNYVQILVNDPMGQALSVFAIAIMLIGVIVMKKLVVIKV